MSVSEARRKHVQTTLIVFAVVAGVVTGVVTALTGNILLGAAYGILPGLILGVLAWFRISRGGLIKPKSSKDRPGPF